jgi:hypothetical protein
VIGDSSIQKLRPRELEELFAELIRGGGFGGPLSLSTVSNLHRLVHKALSDAVYAGFVNDNAAGRRRHLNHRVY